MELGRCQYSLVSLEWACIKSHCNSPLCLDEVRDEERNSLLVVRWVWFTCEVGRCHCHTNLHLRFQVSLVDGTQMSVGCY